MRELWDEARQYGQVDLFTNKSGFYSCTITFFSIEHTELKANSGFGHKDVEDALRAAITSAKRVVGEVAKMSTTLQLEKKA